MIDKSGIINTAQKYASKGLIDKAISEYEKLLKERKDGNIHNTIGDLYLRKGAERDAVESYTIAADIFKKDGFYPKAIALYKKILNIMPNNVDSLIALAKLNGDKGLIGNAIDSYYRAAEIYNKEGSSEKATMVAEKMLELASTDLIARSKIAYLYFKVGHRERAANEYSSIASTYLENDDTDKAKEFFDKAIEYDQGNVSALIGLSKIALKGNNPDQAFDVLDNAISQDPNNKEALLAYAKLAIDADRNEDTQRVLALLIDLDPASMETKKLLGTYNLKQGNVEEAWEELMPVIDNALEGEKWDEAHEIINNFSDLNTIPVSERLLRIYKAQGDNIAVSNELKQLASLHVTEGRNEDALRLYREVLEFNPDDAAASEKINELEAELGIEQSAQDTEIVIEEQREDNSISVPEHNEVNFPDAQTSTSVEHTLTENTHISSPGNDESALSTSPEDHVPSEESHIHNIEPDEGASPSQVQTQHEKDGSDEITVMPAACETQQDSAAPESVTAMSAEEFIAKKAEADFYLQQGLDDEAKKIYEALSAAFPDNTDISTKLDSLKSGAPKEEDKPAEEIKIDHEHKSSVDDDLQALFTQFEKKEEKDIDYEAHYVAGLDFKQKGHLDDAIHELQIAAKDPEKVQRNSTMLALCYMSKGSYPLAIAEFNKILDSMSPTDSMYLHVEYELANAHLNNKDNDRALELFSEIHAQDRDFKDVSSKIDYLNQQTGHTHDDQQKSKRDRVSYI